MRPVSALVIYIVVVFFGGALLAPWLWWLAQTEAHAFPHIAGAPFHRFEHRAFLILALAGLWPLLKKLGAKSAGDLGVVMPYGQSKKFIGGLFLGFCSLAIVAGMAVAFAERTIAPNLTAYKIIGTVFGAIVAAAVVAVLEEILFRGGIFGGLRRFLWWPFALAISSALYALVHFFEHAELTGAVTWYSGLVLLPQMLRGFIDLHVLVPGFFNLTLVGILLGLAYQRTGNLYFSIGMHGGWIFWLKIYGTITVATAPGVSWFWGSDKMIDGWLAFVVLAITLFIFRFLPLQKRSPFQI